MRAGSLLWSMGDMAAGGSTGHLAGLTRGMTAMVRRLAGNQPDLTHINDSKTNHRFLQPMHLYSQASTCKKTYGQIRRGTAIFKLI